MADRAAGEPMASSAQSAVQPACLRLPGSQPRDQGFASTIPLPRDDVLRFEPNRQRGMVECRDPRRQILALRPRRRNGSVVARVGESIEPAALCSLGRAAVAGSIDQPEAGPIGGHGQRERAEVCDGPLRDDRGAPRDREGRSRLPQLVTQNGLQAPVAEEQVATITGRQTVLVVTHALGRDPFLARAHHRQRAERSRQKLVGIAIMAVDDVMGQDDWAIACSHQHRQK